MRIYQSASTTILVLHDLQTTSSTLNSGTLHIKTTVVYKLLACIFEVIACSFKVIREFPLCPDNTGAI